MSGYIRFGILIVVIVIMVGWWGSVEYADHQKKEALVSQQAPDFVLSDIEGKKHSLSEFKGKIIYMKFWASWCGECIKQVVAQRKLEEELSNNPNIVFINVSVDEDEAAWRKSVVRNKLNALELISVDGLDSEIDLNYSLQEIPRYVLINKSGIILDADAPKPSEISTSFFDDHL
jgi:thiol-disulfide isomerase/thioredoxin